jgi:hypothetical protein
MPRDDSLLLDMLRAADADIPRLIEFLRRQLARHE